MKAFAELTERGQVRRLRQLAVIALQQYPLDVARLQFLAYNYNCMFQFATPTGERYVLRVNWPGNRTKTDIESEMAWLAAISQETEIVVPAPVANQSGEFVTTVSATGVPEPRHCVIFTWVGGRKPNRRPSLATIRRHGATLARLQDHADGFQPPPGFTARKHDTVWMFGEPSMLTDEDSAALPSRQREVLVLAEERAQAELDRCYRNREDLRFLHGDLHLGNIKIHRGDIQVLDFDDSDWCFPAQDIGIVLFYYQQYQPRSDYPAIRESFLTGYTDLRSLPGPEDGLIETARHARGLELVSFLHQSENPAFRAILPGVLDDIQPELCRWLA